MLVQDLLPAGIANPAVSSSQGGCLGFPCLLGDLAPGASATIVVVGVVTQTTAGQLTNTASLTTQTDLAPGSLTTASAVHSVAAVADLALALDSTPTAVAGLTATVVAQVTNLGPSPADGAIVTLTLPAGTTFNSTLLPPGWVAASTRMAQSHCRPPSPSPPAPRYR